jgi:hypothetical protein
VLSSLSNDFTAVSFALLSELGCFEEIGKCGIWGREFAPCAAPRVLYHPIAVDVDMHEKPLRVQSLLLRAAARAVRRVVRGLPRLVFHLEHSVGLALQQLRKGQNVGKVVVQVYAERCQQPPAASLGDSAELVSGGGGGLGLATARWLAWQSHGRHLLLVSRGGTLAVAAARAMREAGAKARAGRCDVGNATEWAALAAGAWLELPPLGGLWHAAGVLVDSLLDN